MDGGRGGEGKRGGVREGEEGGRGGEGSRRGGREGGRGRNQFNAINS